MKDMSNWINQISWPLLRESLLLMRVDRPIGTWLVMWPALWAVVAAGGTQPDLALMAIIIVGAFVMRSAGCVANDLADRNFDPHVERTRNRPLAAKRISVLAASTLLFILLSIALWLVFQLNTLAIQLSFGGAALAVTYPLMKRFIPIPQVYLGIAFGWGVIIAWAAAANTVPLEAWLMFGATVAWTTGFDTIYGMMDRDDDLEIGVKSTAIFFGRYDIGMVMVLYAVMLVLLLAVGLRLTLSWPFFISLMVAQAQMAWQICRVQGYSQDELLWAFLSNRWIGMIICIGFGLRVH
ncbi:MAG: 4-hydroxybenzoate octaprenyltransferase [Magnetococcales bacterium]|nr:4-hydroxybenzoate octaprenyltransferase [Magnetococcales bacterium]